MSLIRWTWPINSGSDAARYLLLSQFPASEHGDVKADDFVNKYNSDLTNGVGQLVRTVIHHDD